MHKGNIKEIVINYGRSGVTWLFCWGIQDTSHGCVWRSWDLNQVGVFGRPYAVWLCQKVKLKYEMERGEIKLLVKWNNEGSSVASSLCIDLFHSLRCNNMITFFHSTNRNVLTEICVHHYSKISQHFLGSR